MLDSTRPIGGTLNTTLGRPKTTSADVLSSCSDSPVKTVSAPAGKQAWFALRATYSRELKIRTLLEEKGVRAFVPMIWRKIEKNGKQIRTLVPAVSSLCFVCWTRGSLDAFIRSFGDRRPVNYYWDRTAGRPLIIPDKAMEDFISVASTMDEDLIYLKEINPKLREGQMVRVKEGPFKGIEGRIVRIRKSRRILVELPGMLAVASTYVDPQMIELI